MFALRAALAAVVSLTLVSACGESEPRKLKPSELKENSRSLCIDRVDNDGDGAVDCDDPDCEGLCNSAEIEVACDDGEDNDGDGRVDCDDPNCGTPQGCGPENTDERCSDGRDNDSDQIVDCFDPDCRGSQDVDFCGAENTADRCRDELDNDQDGKIDCYDTDCAATVPCNPPAPENTAAACADTRDNDGDGLVDCRDPNCREVRVSGCAPNETAALCTDTRDNDGDGATDCADTECASVTACQSVTPEADGTVCKNLVDDDGDGTIDCADSSCRNSAAVTYCGTESGTRCSDGIDNDGDTTKDCADSDCAAAPACAPIEREDTLAECSNARDDDGDGKVDCKDSDCAGASVCVPENTAAACADAFDNDADGAVDCADSDCATIPACQNPENDTAECGDGNDNDSDGLKDCADSGCAADARCESVESKCNDAFDNDADGAVDCADTDCATAAACTASTETSCVNGLDDDGDGFRDCADFDCLLDFTVTACDSPALTVHDLQDATDNDAFTATRGDETNDPVRLRGVVVQFVSPFDERELYVADVGAAGSYHGVRIFLRGDAQSAGLATGDEIDVAGLVTEFAGETEVLGYAVRIGGSANIPPAIEVGVAALDEALPQAERGNDRYRTNATTGAIIDPYDDTLVAERYEGTLVTFVDVEVVEIHRYEDGSLEAVEVAATPYIIGDPTFFVGARYAEPTAVPSVGQHIDSVTGILSYTRYALATGFLQQYRVEARTASDWRFTVIVDSDQDGLSDDDEEALGTDPFDDDSDDDFFADGFEVGDPLAPYDSDYDGIIDALDSFLLDVDGDNVPNELDAWELTGLYDDRDGDGVINASDPDSDNDFVCDPGVTEGTDGCVYVDGEPDQCPYAPSTPTSTDWPASAVRNTDPEVDGSGDACDWDADGDFWPNPYDNCPYNANFDQADANQNGIGDVCDLFAFTPLACANTRNGGFLECDLIIEEVLYNLSASAAAGVVDANRDDAGSATQDEFVEIRNVSVFDLDLSGLRLDDDYSATTSTPRHRFPTGTVLRPGQRLVVFAGGAPALFPSFVVVQTASTGLLGLNNGGDVVSIRDNAGTVLVQLDFAGGAGADFDPTIDYNVSATRYPEGTDTWALHPELFDGAKEAYWTISPGSAPDNGLP